MKEINFSNKGLGQSLSPDYVDTIQESTRAKFEALIKVLAISSPNITILNGCVITIDGNDYSMTPGVAYYNGKMYSVPEFPLETASGGDVPVWITNQSYTAQARYGDNQLRDTFYDNQLLLSMAAPGSGLADYNNTDNLFDLLCTAINDKLINSAPGTLDTLNEIADALGNDPNLATTLTNMINTLKGSPPATLDSLEKLAAAINNDPDFFSSVTAEIGNAVSPKANKAQSAWVDIPLNNGWTALRGRTPQYMKDEFGFVRLRGTLDASAATSDIVTTSTGLPVGFRPPTGTTNEATNFAATDHQAIDLFRRLSIIENNGQLQINGYQSTDKPTLDGVIFDTRAY